MSSDQASFRRVVIVGGGTAGWIAAAALSKVLGHLVEIELIESDKIGTVGVGEATIPQIRRLNAVLGIDENECLKRTQGTFKLGIEFNNWGEIGESYLHTFGDPGINLAGTRFHHYWLRARQNSSDKSYWDYSLHNKAAYAHKFGRLDSVGNTSMTGLAYAFHFDASLYAQFMREVAEANGVKRIEGIVTDVSLAVESGFIERVTLENGQVVGGDLFIDCSGFRGLLIGDALGVGYRDWSNWLPMNRAVAVGCEATAPLLPYTKATAHGAGWQWRIPLQHRTGNGHVFCDDYIGVDEATETLLNGLDGAPLSDPKVLKFTTGRRDKFWHKNCVALGLASGFLEPLESTSIHLIQAHVDRLISLWPQGGISDADVNEYNHQVGYEMDRIRDFLILHYKQTRREDTPFWRYVRHMDVPDELKRRLSVFGQNGRIFKDQEDLFKETSWAQVMLGQGLMPKGHHPLADKISEDDLSEFLDNVEHIVERAVEPLPSHQAFISATCAATL